MEFLVTNQVEAVEPDDGDDEYIRLLAKINRSEELDRRVSTHEIAHYLVDRLNGTDRIVRVSVTPTEQWEGICFGERPQAFANAGFAGRDASEVRALLEPVMPFPGEDHSSTADVVQSVFDSVTELLAGEVGERLVLGDASPARDDRRQARELARLICRSEAAIERFIAFCEQQALDLLTPRVPLIISLQIILRMRRDMSGEELDQAAASVLGNLAVTMERIERRRWQDRIDNAATFKPETI
jgi:hypothetical protein